MARIFIDDKLTLKDKVRPSRMNLETRLFEPDTDQPEVSIEFRPPLSSKLMIYLDEPATSSPEQKVKNLHNFIADYLIGWDIENSQGQPVAPIKENFPNVPGPYLNAIEKAIIEGSTKVRAVTKN